ncbi:MAG TPA: phosphotransferase, partial [Spongiibacteraceae bacterium]|nr:phosphotransferase [Spongiibacteraceae bacterium]
MAVYTAVDEEALKRFVADYGRGALAAWEGASEGVENTTYFVSLREGRARREYVLTLFEQLDGEAVQAYAGFTAGFAAAGLPVPYPLRDRDGRSWANLAGKPAILVPRVPGRHPVRPSPAACRQIGEFLGRAHALALASGWHWKGPRSPAWLRGLAGELLPRLAGADQALLSSELAFWDHWRDAARELPQALIHGDLFRDNSLFQRGRLTGVIDFFSAGTDYLLFDLAVVVNDWC